MTWNLKPGDLAVFIGRAVQRDHRDACPHPLTKGGVYTVAQVAVLDGEPRVWVAERPYTSCWLLSRFRPITKPSIECFQKMLAPGPKKKVKEPA